MRGSPRPLVALMFWLLACGPGVDEGIYDRVGMGEHCGPSTKCSGTLTCSARFGQRCVELGSFPWQWGTSHADAATDVSVGGDGRIVAAGATDGSLDGQSASGEQDSFVTVFADDGTKLWTRQWGTSADDVAWSLGIGDDGDIYVAGSTGGLPMLADPGNATVETGTDAFVVKLGANGELSWERRWNSGGPGDGALAVSAAEEHGVYVAGIVTGDSGNPQMGMSDIFVRKYAIDGAEQWIDRFGSTGSDFGYALAVDAKGNAYLTGPTSAALDGQDHQGGTDAYLSKYSADGVRLWTRQWGTADKDMGNDVAVDAAGQVYVVGRTGERERDDADAFLSKWTAQGDLVWTEQWGSINAYDDPTALHIDGNGAIFVTGFTEGAWDGASSHGWGDLFVTQFDPDGTRGWTRIEGTAEGTESAFGIASIGGRLVVGGGSTGSFAGRNRGSGDIILLIVGSPKESS